MLCPFPPSSIPGHSCGYGLAFHTNNTCSWIYASHAAVAFQALFLVERWHCVRGLWKTIPFLVTHLLVSGQTSFFIGVHRLRFRYTRSICYYWCFHKTRCSVLPDAGGAIQSEVVQDFLYLGSRFVRLVLDGKHNPVPLLSCFNKQLMPLIHFEKWLSTLTTFTSSR